MKAKNPLKTGSRERNAVVYGPFFSSLLTKRRFMSLIMGPVFGVSTSCGCAQVREYNKQTPEMAPQRTVESVSSEQALRFQLTSGETLEGFLVRRHWPDLTLMGTDSTRVIDGRQVVTIWERGVDKSKGAWVGAAIVAVPFGILAYSLSQHPLCIRFESYQCPEDAGGSSQAWATFGGALFGGIIGCIVGSSLSEGSPKWQRIYP